MSEPSAYEQLTDKQKLFVDAYLSCGYNASEAARKAKYKVPMQEGYRLLRKAEIKAAIDECLREKHLSANEVLARIGDQSCSTIEDFISLNKKKEPEIDLKKAQERGKLHLVQEIIQQKFFDKSKGAEVTELKIKLYNAQKSLNDLLRVHQLLGDKEKETLERKLLETRLQLAEIELVSLRKSNGGDPNNRNIEGRPRPQGGPGTGPCGLYHQALDPSIYPDGRLAHEGAVDLLQPCPVCGGDPFRRSEG